MTIDLMHGVLDEWTSRSTVHRLYCGTSDFLGYLRKRKDKYGSWESADSSIPSLTVDDSTHAGMRACEIAVQEGHRVIFFVNPQQIISSEVYFFTIMDTIIDSLRHRAGADHRIEYHIDDATRVLRQEMRVTLMKLTGEALAKAITSLLREYVREPISVPAPLRPISVDDIRSLASKGVEIGNHGWCHRDIGPLSEGEIASDIQQTHNWLQATVGSVKPCYAVPFGVVADSKLHVLESLPLSILLADERIPPGQIAKNVWNRTDITAKIRGNV